MYEITHSRKKIISGHANKYPALRRMRLKVLLGPSQSRHTKPLKGFDKFKDCIFFLKKKKKKGYIFTLRVRSDTILRLRFLQSWLMVDRVNASKNMHEKIRHPLQKTRSRCGKTGGWRKHRPAAACEGSSTAHTHTHTLHTCFYSSATTGPNSFSSPDDESAY